jgi:hypothetical protein
MPLLPPRRKRASQPKPWLDRRDRRITHNYRQRYPRRVATLVFVRTDDGHCLVQSDWAEKNGLPSLILKRKIENPREDWPQLIRLACWIGGYDEARCLAILQEVSRCEATRTCRLAITPKVFAFKEFGGKGQPIMLAEGTF